MDKKYIARMMLAGGTTAGLLASGAAQAVDFNITGFVRQEIAISVTDDENPFNQSGNPFMGRRIENITTPGVFTAKGAPYDNGTYATNLGNVFTNPNIYRNAPFGPAAPLGLAVEAGTIPGRLNGACASGDAPPCGNYGQALREDNNFNMFATRAEIDVQAQWTDSIKTFVKFRAFGEAVNNFGDAFSGDLFRSTAGGFHGGRAGNVLEWNSPSFIVDVPSAYLDYNAGSLWVRVGQQQIAWGEAYFFRVFDVPNGLDTRRHFTLDVAAEEFSDKRVASPAVRASYTFNNGFELDGFVQMFAPTTIVGTNSPYNVVASGFSWRDSTGEFDEARNTLNFGFRLNMPVTDKLTLGVMAVNRRNPDGVVRWEDAPLTLSDGTANPYCFGPNNGTAAILSSLGLVSTDTNNNGIFDRDELLTPLSGGRCGSDASPDPVATASWAEWHTMSGKSRLNPVEGVLSFLNLGQTNASGTNANNLAAANFGLGTPEQIFPVLCQGSVSSCAPNLARTPWTPNNSNATLDAFFNGFAFPRGYNTREFKRESIFGASFNYIFESEPGSWLDQLIVRGEVSYTPDKKFTDLTLNHNYIESDEVSSALILEKYHNVFPALPATYLVAQWMHKTDSDLFGRHLSGMNHDFDDDAQCLPAFNLVNNTADNGRCGRPEGTDSANYVSFAFQQPFPNLIWRADFAMLIDVQGGVLLQPGLRYKPSTDWQFDLYANILQDFSPDQNDDVVETLDFADEVFARVSFYF